MIVAALLHDIGHLLEGQRHHWIGVIDHDRVAIHWLTPADSASASSD